MLAWEIVFGKFKYSLLYKNKYLWNTFSRVQKHIMPFVNAALDNIGIWNCMLQIASRFEKCEKKVKKLEKKVGKHFMARIPELSLRVSEAISIARSVSFNKPSGQRFFF